MLSYAKPTRGISLNRTHPLSKGLVGCWVYNENTGIEISDSSRNCENGVMNNEITWAGNGLIFDGIDDRYIVASTALSISDAVSIFFVFKDTSFSSFYSNIVSKGWVLSPVVNYAIQIYNVSPRTLMFYYSTAGEYYNYYLTSAITTNQYYSIGLTHTYTVAASTMFYIDGISRPGTWDGDGGGSATTVAESLIVGDDLWDELFDGELVCMYIYNRYLSAEEMKQLHIDPYQIFYNRTTRGILYSPVTASKIPLYMHHYKMLAV